MRGFVPKADDYEWTQERGAEVAQVSAEEYALALRYLKERGLPASVFFMVAGDERIGGEGESSGTEW